MSRKQCSFFARGRCTRGAECTFAHSGGDNTTGDDKDKHKTNPCDKFHSKGHCPYGSRCRFLHDELDYDTVLVERLGSQRVAGLRRPVAAASSSASASASSASTAAQQCRWFAELTCRKGAACRFAHDPSQLRTRQAFDALVRTHLEHAHGAHAARTAALRKQLDAIDALEGGAGSAQRTSITYADMRRRELARTAVVAKLAEAQQQRAAFERDVACVCAEAASATRDDAVPRSLDQRLRASVARAARRAGVGGDPLPAFAFKHEFLELVRAHPVVIVTASTGAGKSTQLPQYLLDLDPAHFAPLAQRRRIACTQPRKIAATGLRERVTKEYYQLADDAKIPANFQSVVGSVVGGGRSGRRVHSHTRLAYVTDAVLVLELARDPELRRYGVVVVDEAHERSMHTDILLVRLKALAQRRRADFRLVVTSATLDTDKFARYFATSAPSAESAPLPLPPVLSIPGRTFPVDVCWASESLWSGVASSGRGGGGVGEAYVTAAVEKVAEIVRASRARGRDDGRTGAGDGSQRDDILVFLTGQRDVERACSRLRTGALRADVEAGHVLVLPLHGAVPPDEQRAALLPAKAGVRKIVVATNVAETSVTIDGVRHVVDTGLANQVHYDAQRHLSALRVSPISRSSAVQRAGRAGRTAPGVVHRLYSRDDFDEMGDAPPAEMLRTDPTSAVLALKSLGVPDVLSFDFIDAPDGAALRDALSELTQLGALDNTGTLTDSGRIMARLPLPPTLAALVLAARRHRCVRDAVLAAAVVACGGRLFVRPRDCERDADTHKAALCDPRSDLLTYAKVFAMWLRKPVNQRKTWCRDQFVSARTLAAAHRVARDIISTLSVHGVAVESLPSPPPAPHHRSDSTADESSFDDTSDTSSVLSSDSEFGDATAAEVVRVEDEHEDEARALALLRAIGDAFCLNVAALQSGGRGTSFFAPQRDQTAVVHPSSALVAGGARPRVVVFGEMRQTSRTFLQNVTVLDDVLDSLPTAAKLLGSALDGIAQHAQISNVGPALISSLIGRGGANLVELQRRTHVQIDVDFDARTVDVWYARGVGGDAALAAVRAELARIGERLERECVVAPDVAGATSAVVGCGGVTQHLLQGADTLRCALRNLPRDVSELDVEQRFAELGYDVIDVHLGERSNARQSDARRWGVVTFASPQLAERAERELDGYHWPSSDDVGANGTLEVGVCRVGGHSHDNDGSGLVAAAGTTLVQGARVDFTWFYGRCRGFGFVEFANSAAARAACDAVHMRAQLRGTRLMCRVQDKERKAPAGTSATSSGAPATPATTTAVAEKERGASLWVGNLPPDVSESELRAVFAQHALVKGVLVVRDPPDAEPELGDEFVKLRSMATAACDGDDSANVLLVQTRVAARNAACGALVTFSTPAAAERAVRRFDGQREHLGSGAVSATLDIGLSIAIDTHVHEAVRERLSVLIDTVTGDAKARTVVSGPRPKCNGRGVTYRIDGATAADIERVRRLFNIACAGALLSPPTELYQHLAVLWTGAGRKFVDAVQREHGCYVVYSRRHGFTIRVYARDADTEQRVRDALLAYIAKAAEHDRTVKLRLQPGVLKQLVGNDGGGLERLRKQADAAQVVPNFLRQELSVVGSADAVNIVEVRVRAATNEARQRAALRRKKATSAAATLVAASNGSTAAAGGGGDDDDSGGECVICLLELEPPTYRLQMCGHEFCQPCIQQQLHVAVSSNEFPLVCSVDNCRKPLVVRDIAALLSADNRHALYRASVRAFMNKHPTQYKPCVTTDCPQVLHVADGVAGDAGSSATVTCATCATHVCIECMQPAHDGQTCAEYKVAQSSDGQFEAYLRAAGSTIKKCGRCSAHVHKFDGCNHITCVCGAHFCWVCQDVFDTASECYSHLNAKHGGVFDYPLN